MKNALLTCLFLQVGGNYFHFEGSNKVFFPGMYIRTYSNTHKAETSRCSSFSKAVVENYSDFENGNKVSFLVSDKRIVMNILCDHMIYDVKATCSFSKVVETSLVIQCIVLCCIYKANLCCFFARKAQETQKIKN